MVQQITRSSVLESATGFINDTMLRRLLQTSVENEYLRDKGEPEMLQLIHDTLASYKTEITAAAEKYGKPIEKVAHDMPFGLKYVLRHCGYPTEQKIPTARAPKQPKQPSPTYSGAKSAEVSAGRLISSEHKISAGISLVGAAMSGVGAYSSLSRAFSGDTPDGKPDWSNVSVGLLSAAMAAGLTYAGVQSLRGVEVFR